jgi:hypothetical protein
MVKIIVSGLQIIGNLATVLSLSFPPLFGNLLRSFVGYFQFDITSAFRVGCFMKEMGMSTEGSYLPALLMNGILVIIVMVVVLLIYFVHVAKLKAKLSDEQVKIEIEIFFAKVDKDGDGIELEELTIMVQNLDSSVETHVIEKLFAEADALGEGSDKNSGALTAQQFYNAAAATVNKEDKSRLDLGDILQKSRAAAVKADAMGRLFLLQFLLYPALTNKIFEAFVCRDLGHGLSLLINDYTIDCASDWYWGVVYPLCSMLVVAWPIGLPAMLFFVMYRARNKIKQDDPDTIMQFAFVIGDYKKDYYYWEVVELSRKLMLSGLLGFVRRGSVAQSVAGTLIAFVFFALAFHHRPFKSMTLNRIKFISEFQVFGVLLISVVLQTYGTDINTELLTEKIYGQILVVITVMMLPVTVYFVVKNIVDLRAVSKELSDKAEIAEAERLVEKAAFDSMTPEEQNAAKHKNELTRVQAELQPMSLMQLRSIGQKRGLSDLEMGLVFNAGNPRNSLAELLAHKKLFADGDEPLPESLLVTSLVDLHKEKGWWPPARHSRFVEALRKNPKNLADEQSNDDVTSDSRFQKIATAVGVELPDARAYFLLRAHEMPWGEELANKKKEESVMNKVAAAMITIFPALQDYSQLPKVTMVLETTNADVDADLAALGDEIATALQIDWREVEVIRTKVGGIVNKGQRSLTDAEAEQKLDSLKNLSNLSTKEREKFLKRQAKYDAQTAKREAKIGRKEQRRDAKREDRANKTETKINQNISFDLIISSANPTAVMDDFHGQMLDAGSSLRLSDVSGMKIDFSKIPVFSTVPAVEYKRQIHVGYEEAAKILDQPVDIISQKLAWACTLKLQMNPLEIVEMLAEEAQNITATEEPEESTKIDGEDETGNESDADVSTLFSDEDTDDEMKRLMNQLAKEVAAALGINKSRVTVSLPGTGVGGKPRANANEYEIAFNIQYKAMRSGLTNAVAKTLTNTKTGPKKLNGSSSIVELEAQLANADSKLRQGIVGSHIDITATPVYTFLCSHDVFIKWADKQLIHVEPPAPLIAPLVVLKKVSDTVEKHPTKSLAVILLVFAGLWALLVLVLAATEDTTESDSTQVVTTNVAVSTNCPSTHPYAFAGSNSPGTRCCDNALTGPPTESFSTCGLFATQGWLAYTSKCCAGRHVACPSSSTCVHNGLALGTAGLRTAVDIENFDTPEDGKLSPALADVNEPCDSTGYALSDDSICRTDMIFIGFGDWRVSNSAVTWTEASSTIHTAAKSASYSPVWPDFATVLPSSVRSVIVDYDVGKTFLSTETCRSSSGVAAVTSHPGINLRTRTYSCSLWGRECVACDIGKFATNVGTAACKVCNPCDDPGQTITTPCTNHSDTLCGCDTPGYWVNASSCATNICLCESGVALSGVYCPADGDPLCSSCDVGYHLTNSLLCEINVCTCQLGTPARNASCEVHLSETCESCAPGNFIADGGHICGPCQPVLHASAITCTSDADVNPAQCEQGYRVEGNDCTLNTCVCPQGTPAIGVSCPSHGATACRSIVQSSVTMAVDIATVNIDTVTRAQFEQEFSVATKDAMETACSCEIDHVIVTSIVGGSSIVSFSIISTFTSDAVTAALTELINAPVTVILMDTTFGSFSTGSLSAPIPLAACTEIGYELIGELCVATECVCANGNGASGPACVDVSVPQCSTCDDGYHIINNHACVENICTCSNGVTATGVDCTTHDGAICSSCSDFYHLDDVYACKENSCTCANGAGATGSACAIDNNALCVSCESGYYFTQSGTNCTVCDECEGDGSTVVTACAAESNTVCECNTNGGHFLSDFVCTVCSVCDGPGQVVQSTCTADTDTICGCASEFFLNSTTCTACSACDGAGLTIATACATNADTICGCASSYFLDSAECTACNACNGTGVSISTACAADADTICGCASGYFNDSAVCSVCNSCDGANQVASTYCAAAADTVCSCDAGYHLAEASGICVENTCTCEHGTPTTGASCPNHDTTLCSTTCDLGYHSDGAEGCAANICTCEGGIEVMGTACAVHDSVNCETCNAGHYNDGDGACLACAAGKHLDPGTLICVDCVAGKYTEEEGASACQFCDSGRYSAVVGSNDGTNCIDCGVGNAANVLRTACTSVLGEDNSNLKGLIHCPNCHYIEGACVARVGGENCSAPDSCYTTVSGSTADSSSWPPGTGSMNQLVGESPSMVTVLGATASDPAEQWGPPSLYQLVLDTPMLVTVSTCNPGTAGFNGLSGTSTLSILSPCLDTVEYQSSSATMCAALADTIGMPVGDTVAHELRNARLLDGAHVLHVVGKNNEPFSDSAYELSISCTPIQDTCTGTDTSVAGGCAQTDCSNCFGVMRPEFGQIGTCSADGLLAEGAQCTQTCLPEYWHGADTITCQNNELNFLTVVCSACTNCAVPGKRQVSACLDTADSVCECDFDAGFWGDGTTCTSCTDCSFDGSKLEASACTPDSDATCSCADGYWGDETTCTACIVCLDTDGKEESAACTSSADTVCTCMTGFFGDGTSCTACTVCDAADGKEESVACASSVDTVCTCMTGFFGDGTSCPACTVCDATDGKEESVACTPSTDSVCACMTGFFGDGTSCPACTVCDAADGKEEATACSATVDTQCSCIAGYWGGGSSCAACTDCAAQGLPEVIACTNSADTVCACAEGYWGDGAGLCTVCTTCELAGQKQESAACTSTADAVCSCIAKWYQTESGCAECASGQFSEPGATSCTICNEITSAAAVDCTGADDAVATACWSGFRLQNGRCVVCDAIPNAEVVTCTTEDDEMASSCTFGFHVEEGVCVENVCSCNHGTAVVIDSSITDCSGDSDCVSCDLGFHLEGSECLANVCSCPNGTPAAAVVVAPSCVDIPMCMVPADTTGYDMSAAGDGNLALNSFDVAVTCAEGYSNMNSGGAMAEACAIHGFAYSLSGCEAIRYDIVVVDAQTTEQGECSAANGYWASEGKTCWIRGNSLASQITQCTGKCAASGLLDAPISSWIDPLYGSGNSEPINNQGYKIALCAALCPGYVPTDPTGGNGADNVNPWKDTVPACENSEWGDRCYLEDKPAMEADWNIDSVFSGHRTNDFTRLCPCNLTGNLTGSFVLESDGCNSLGAVADLSTNQLVFTSEPALDGSTATPDMANDGNLAQDHPNEYHSQAEYNPWWAVQLTGVTANPSITFRARDSSTNNYGNLLDFYIGSSSEWQNSTLCQSLTVEDGGQYTFDCPGTGSFVIVRVPESACSPTACASYEVGQSTLQLPEVTVNGGECQSGEPPSLPPSLRACVPACLRACVPACLRACVPACLRACVPGWLRLTHATVFVGFAGIGSSYLFRVDNDYVIDATKKVTPHPHDHDRLSRGPARSTQHAARSPPAAALVVRSKNADLIETN